MFPNIVGQYQQGFDRGRQQLATRLAGQAFTAQPDQQQVALGQLAGVDPSAAMQMQDRFTQQAKAQQVDHNAKLNGAARFMLDAVNSKDPARIQGAWSAVSPYLSQLTGKQAPPQWDDSMLPAVYQTIANTGGMPEQKPIQLSSGAQLVDPTGKVLADNPTEQHDTGELATLRAMQADPSLLDTYRKAHPASGGGMARAPVGYRFTQDGSLEAIPGGPADSSGTGQGLTDDAIDNAAWQYIGTGRLPTIGRGKEGVAQRTAIMNRTAKIAKDAGISPAELQTVPGRNRALQSSLTNLQKTSDVMEKSEQAFINNTNTALNISSKVDRTGSPVINKWLLGGRDALGDPDVRALDAAITTMSVDYARIMSGATGAGGTPISTAEEAKQLIKKELSDKSLRAVVDVLNQDIQGQQAAVHAQRGKILSAMQQMHDASAPPLAQPPASPSIAPTQPATGDFSHLWGN
jgi:hypothetical protein